MRKKSFAGALFLVGLLVFGFRITSVLWPHSIPAQNPASTAITSPLPRAEKVAPVKPVSPLPPAEKVAVVKPAKTPEAHTFRKAAVRSNPPSAKVASLTPSAPASPALLEIEVVHKFTDAHLSIWVDDSLTYTHTLEGTEKKHLVVFHQVQGHEFHAMQLSPGKHLLRVQVSTSAANGEQSGTVTGELVSGKEKQQHFDGS